MSPLPENPGFVLGGRVPFDAPDRVIYAWVTLESLSPSGEVPMRFPVYALLVLLVAAGLYFAVEHWNAPQKELPSSPPVRQPVPRAPQVEPIRHPLPPPDVDTETQPSGPLQQPVPSLADSGPYVREVLHWLYSGDLYGLLIPESFIRRTVVTIDNLPRKQLPLQHLPLKQPEGKFMTTTGSDEAVFIHPENANRYTLYVNLAEALPTDRLVSAYLHMYPLFQRAYEKMGYPGGYFNDRLIEVLDHLLATPSVDRPIKLLAHVRHFRFADPELEALSAGQKIILRMGPDNADRIRDKLRDVRDALLMASTPR